MDLSYVITRLEQNKHVIPSQLSGLNAEQYTWRPSPEKWCLLEVVCHLIDEEKEDFRARVQHCLERPNEAMSKIDPQGWVSSRKYMENNYEESINTWIMERENSLNYLKSLENPPLSNTYQHPILGPMSANLFLMNWLAHDYLHIRQINRMHYLYFQTQTNESLDYAGDW